MDLHTRLTFIAAGLALLAGAALASSTHPTSAQANTPTPIPAAAPDADGGQLPSLKNKVNPHKYSNMDSILNQAVAQYEQSSRSSAAAQSAANRAPVSSELSIAVTFYTNTQFTQAIVGLLQGVGVHPRNIGEDYIETYVPVGLLPVASQLPGVMSVRSIVPPQPAQILDDNLGSAAHNAPARNTAGFSGRDVMDMPVFEVGMCYIDAGGVFQQSLSETLSQSHGENRWHKFLRLR